MLSILIHYLQAKLATLPYIDRSLGLGLQVLRGDDRVMAVYKGGEQQLINFDNVNSLVYLVQNGEVQRETQEHEFIACEYTVKETYRLRAILYSQGKEDVNCESFSQQVAEGIKRNIVGQQPQLTTAINADNVNITVTGTDLLKANVWSSQFSLPNTLKETDILIAIDFNILIEGNEQCFAGEPCATSDFIFDFSGITALKASAWVSKQTEAETNIYDFPELYGMKIDFGQLDNMPLKPGQYSQPVNITIGGINYGRVTITAPPFPIEDEQYLNFAYSVK